MWCGWGVSGGNVYGNGFVGGVYHTHQSMESIISYINAFAYFKWDEMKRRKSKVYEHLHM